MKIEMKLNAHGKGGKVYRAGEVLSVPDDEAKAMIKAGYAVELPEEKKAFKASKPTTE